MSHNPPTYLRLIVATVLLVPTIQCARLGEAPVVFTEQNMLPAQPIVTGETKPGMGADGGPASWSFWVKNRTAASDALLGSFTPFYKVNAVRLAVSANFVLYRDALESTLNSAQANAVLTTLESAYTNLRSIYGAGDHPYANDGARIVILAINILDDYSTTGNYVGGFFSPRDLYSNGFTRSLFTDPVALQQYSQYISALGGYSNEMNIIYYDLNPGYTTNSAQVNDIVIHELSHLFTYSKRVVKQRLVNHDLWIAEGIAENAPHATIGTASVQQLRLQQLASPSTIDHYQDAPQLTDFLTWASKIVGYLQSNLFFNYLRHRAEMNSAGSSATMLTQLMTLQDQTINGLEGILPTYIPGSDFPTLYADYVVTNYLMLLGIPISASTGWNGGAADQTKYSMANVNIGHSGSTVNGTTIKAKYPNVVPFNYEAPKCADGTEGLKPNSYVIFRHKFDGNDKEGWDMPGTGTVAGEQRLRYVINIDSENSIISGSPPTTVRLREHTAVDQSSGNNLLFGSGGFGLNLNDFVHVIVYNPNKTGSCRRFNASLISRRNHSKWVGFNTLGTQPSPDFEWQSETGARWVNNQNGSYYRPGGIAAFAGGSYNNNFVYVTDYTNMSVQKVNLDDGTAMGRLGSTAVTCPSSGSGWTTNIERYVNNYCTHSFDSPQGIHADSSHNIYVADTQNRRLVKYNSAGIFQGWLGRNGAGNDTWQAAGTEMAPLDLYNNGAVDDPRMFLLPWTMTSDATYLYVVDYGARRIVRRLLSTGAFNAYIGNGNNAWNTSTASQVGTSGSTAGYFTDPRGIVIVGANMYIVDEGNYRVVRVDTSSGASTGWIGNGNGWQGMATAPPGTGSSLPGRFNKPSAIAADATYLYIADRLNDRISRWNIATGNFAGWVGHGKVGWEMTASAPATDPYAGVSFYPPDYYAEPHGLALVTSTQKGTKNNYLYLTSVYNGRVTRVNISCVDAPSSETCNPNLVSPFTP
ncbi:MAG: hypothetical protein ACOY5B_04140 [Spirochaetota bacterium]